MKREFFSVIGSIPKEFKGKEKDYISTSLVNYCYRTGLFDMSLNEFIDEMDKIIEVKQENDFVFHGYKIKIVVGDLPVNN